MSSFNNNNQTSTQFVTIFVPVQVSIELFQTMTVKSMVNRNNSNFPILTATQIFNALSSFEKDNTNVITNVAIVEPVHNNCFETTHQNKTYFASAQQFHPKETFLLEEEAAAAATATCTNNSTKLVCDVENHFVVNNASAQESIENVSASLCTMVSTYVRRACTESNLFRQVLESCVFDFQGNNEATNTVNVNVVNGNNSQINCFDRCIQDDCNDFGWSSRSSHFMRSIIISSWKEIIISSLQLFSSFLQVLASLSNTAIEATTVTTNTTTTTSSSKHHCHQQHEKKCCYPLYTNYYTTNNTNNSINCLKQDPKKCLLQPQPQPQLQQQQQQQQPIISF